MPFQAYQTWGKQVVNERVEAHLPLVYRLASSLAGRAVAAGIEMGDLIHTGVLGLYDAAHSFEPKRGTTFGAFAKPFVRGAMLDEIAKSKNESRSVRDKYHRIRAAEDQLVRELMREPTTRELSAAIGIEERLLSTWMSDIGMRDDTSLDELTDKDAFQPQDKGVTYQPELCLLRDETRAGLVVALGKLSLREQQLLYLYYQEELTLKEIGYVLDLSESQVSRIHKKALSRLKEMLGD